MRGDVWAYVDAEGAEQICDTVTIAGLVHSQTLDDATLVRRADGTSMRFQRLAAIRPLREAVAACAAAGAPLPPVKYAPQLDNIPAANSDSWYYTDDGDRERGPMPLAQMRRLVEEGWVVGPRLIKRGATGEPRDISLWAELSAEAIETAHVEADERGAPEADERAEDEWDWDEADEVEWVFLDDDGAMQGPFGTEEMRAWVRQGALGLTRMVNVAGGEPDGMRPLAQWAELAVAAPQAADAEVADEEEAAEAEAAEAEAIAARLAAAKAEMAAAKAAAAEAPAAEAAEEPAAAGVTVDDATEWYFVDDSGSTQGPFATKRLCKWLEKGFLLGDRLCRPASAAAGADETVEWRPIASWAVLAAAAEEASASEAAEAAEAAHAAHAAYAAQPAEAPHEAQQAAGLEAAEPTVATAAIAADASADGTDDTLWEYADDHGRIQGPFTARKLLGWLRAGHLKRTRRARLHVVEPLEDPNSTSFAAKFAQAGTFGGASSNPEAFVRLDEWQWFARALATDGVLPAAPAAPLKLDGSQKRGGVVETPMWFYRDPSGVEHGPFPATILQQWHSYGQLPSTTLVRHLSEPAAKARPLSDIPVLGCHAMAPPPPPLTPAGHPSASTEPSIGGDSETGPADGLPTVPPTADEIRAILSGARPPAGSAPARASAAAPPAKRSFEEYTVVGGFSVVNGRFASSEHQGDGYWEAKGIPKHRDERMMNHYFDLAAWQEQRNQQKAKGSKKVKR